MSQIIFNRYIDPIPDEVFLSSLLPICETGYVVSYLAAIYQHRTPAIITVFDPGLTRIKLLYILTRVGHCHSTFSATVHTNRRFLLVR
ncbi:unnamed protein product [Strongylus vulgaris]|uniref:Uncharacterized protein n=1 Tax=Strongylus vulgaris TaxID=40348 RepID=A0A3P7IMD4_STRVU|nr:unnamed protein product [Strongylus vulgaris]